MAKYTLRDYQQAASDAAVRYLQTKPDGHNGLLILPTGSGKSLVVADIASRLNEPLLVLQPSIEILQQNAAKYESYGFKAGVFSASAGRKDVRGVTFATIGSVMNKVEDFAIFSKVLVDECHLVNPKGGQYEEFLEGRRTVGLTATPYRLAQSVDPATLNDTFPEYGSTLKFLTRTRPRVFDSVLYYCQVQTLLDRGYLARLRYFDLTRIDLSNVEVNSTGADYREKSLFEEFERVGMYEYTLSVICRVLRPKNGVPRNGILVFVRFVDDARRIADAIIGCEMVSGETPKRERAAILERFKSGETKVVVNVGVLTTGFDHPALDTIILARPTMSLALYYQMVGRAIRPFAGKEGWVIDLCGSIAKFGKVEDLWIDPGCHGKWVVVNKATGEQLTNVLFKK